MVHYSLMGTVRKERIVLIAMMGLWQLFVLHEALAGQPLETVVAALNHASNAARPAPGLQLLPGGHLDLQPPLQVSSDESRAGFPDSPHRPLMSARTVPHLEAAGANSAAWSAPAAGASSTGHIISPMETLAHNFRQQGLPMARLFENKYSLVHLGLDPRGKPGLWILHKLH